MRLVPWTLSGFGILLATLGYGYHQEQQLVGWDRVCHRAPHRKITAYQTQGLRQVGIQVGLQGWQPTAQWVNDQCRVVAGGRMVLND